MDNNENKRPRMSKAEAARVLGVDINANDYEIESAYTRKNMAMRGQVTAESAEFNRQINEAYDVLRGFEEYSFQGREIGGKKTGEWANIWHYGKYYLLAGVIAFVFIFGMIFSVKNTPEYDMVLGVFGEFIENADSLKVDKVLKIETIINEQNKEINNLRTSFNFISDNKDAEARIVNASYSVRTLLLSGAEHYDVLILDKEQYEFFLEKGALMPLDDVYNQIETNHPELLQDYFSTSIGRVKQENLPDDWENKSHVYAFNLSKNQALNGIDIIGEDQYVAVAFNTKQDQMAKATVYNLLTSITDWYNPEMIKLNNKSKNPDPETEYYRAKDREKDAEYDKVFEEE
ncbi:hypothetical protein [Fastidiosipila sanguinis]|uniref:J domain-containing protein n=1 Tax=Fastidiosipila sanguinis TaxID=236753 RepID=A0A2S0KN19_9FIRM|nr:hypothetical protein [Fastidiosipila sanguinis]AVM42389.1 hypothetical protein C5Q98_03730 [Fastidiosipila sanguinis]